MINQKKYEINDLLRSSPMYNQIKWQKKNWHMQPKSGKGHKSLLNRCRLDFGPQLKSTVHISRPPVRIWRLDCRTSLPTGPQRVG